MALGDDDLELFTADFGVDVYFNDTLSATKALKEEYDEVVVEGQMQSASIGRVKAITCKTTDVSAYGAGTKVTIDMADYYVREMKEVQDGKFTHMLLSTGDQS